MLPLDTSAIQSADTVAAMKVNIIYQEIISPLRYNSPLSVSESLLSLLTSAL